MIIASFPETEEIGMKVAKALHAHYTTINVGKFPDSEYHLKLKKNPNHSTVVILSSMAQNPDDRIIETILAGGIARDYGAKQVILMATYFPYMRQDKHFEKYDSFSSKHIIKLFREFDKIIAIDPHLHRIKNLRELSYKAESVTINRLIADYIAKRFKDKFTILGPDAESSQWDSSIAKMLDRKVVILQKTRMGDKNIKQKEKPLGHDHTFIIIDDIISTGKTLAGALEMAKRQGAKKLVCIGIHGLLAGNAVKLITKHAELITTNTVPNKYAKIDVTPAIIEVLDKYT